MRRLVVALHGHDDDPTAIGDAIAVAMPADRALCVASGPIRTPHGRGWFDPLGDAADPAPPLSSTVDGLRAVIAAASEQAGIDDTAVDVVGWSQGAAVALALALSAQLGWRPATVIALAGWLPNEPDITWDFDAAARDGVRVVLVHGTRDEVVPPAQARSAQRVLERHAVPTEWVEVDAGHDVVALVTAARDAIGGPPT